MKIVVTKNSCATLIGQGVVDYIQYGQIQGDEPHFAQSPIEHRKAIAGPNTSPLSTQKLECSRRNV